MCQRRDSDGLELPRQLGRDRGGPETSVLTVEDGQFRLNLPAKQPELDRGLLGVCCPVPQTEGGASVDLVLFLKFAGPAL